MAYGGAPGSPWLIALAGRLGLLRTRSATAPEACRAAATGARSYFDRAIEKKFSMRWKFRHEVEMLCTIEPEPALSSVVGSR